MYVARQAQSTKTNQFTISMQYLKENMKDKVDFLPADKCEGFPNWYYHFRCVWPDLPKLTRITSLLFLYKTLWKK